VFSTEPELIVDMPENEVIDHTPDSHVVRIHDAIRSGGDVTDDLA
jgi:hypothetical protein